MPSEATWICNRCGCDGVGPIGDLPPNWIGLYSGTSLSLNGVRALGYICEDCTGDLHEFWLAKTTTVDDIRTKIRAAAGGDPDA